MEDIYIRLERHEQMLKSVERELVSLRQVQTEIRSMNRTLATLTTELKHTNEHLNKQEQKIDEIDSQPKIKMQQIAAAVIAALAGGIVSMLLTALFS